MSESHEHKPPAETKAESRPAIETPETSCVAGRAQEGGARVELASGVNKEAWENKGTFHTTANADGSASRIEGWLSLSNEPRSSRDSANQREAAEKGDGSEKRDGGHLIAHSLGGPREESHGKELAQSNLVPMDARINRSYISGVESHIANEMKGGKEIYAQVDVNYKQGSNGEKVPESVTHRFFERGSDGQPKPCSTIPEAWTVVDQRPSMTVGEAVRNATGEQAKDFYSNLPRGASRAD